MINKTKLLILGLTAIALTLVGAFLSWYIASNKYKYEIAILKSDYSLKLKAISDEAAFKLGNEIVRNNQLQQELNELDSKYYRDLEYEKERNKQLSIDVSNGTRRVQFAEANLATCKQSRNTGTISTSMGNGTSIELSTIAGQNILNIREGIIADQAKLRYLQDYIRKVEASRYGKTNIQTEK